MWDSKVMVDTHARMVCNSVSKSMSYAQDDEVTFLFNFTLPGNGGSVGLIGKVPRSTVRR